MESNTQQQLQLAEVRDAELHILEKLRHEEDEQRIGNGRAGCTRAWNSAEDHTRGGRDD